MGHFNKLLLSGGGIKGLAQLGALHHFHERGLLDHLEVFAGTSIGSVINLLLVCGYTPIEIFSDVYNSDYLLKPKPQDFLQIFVKMGLMNIRSFTDRVRFLIEQKLKTPNITMKELYDITGKTFIACATDISTMDTIYISHRSHPNMKCVEAVEYSCNLPVIFQRLIYNEHYMADGAVTNNFPFECLDAKPSDKILGIVVSGNDTSFEASNIAGYLYRMLQMSINTQTSLRVKALQKNKSIMLVTIKCPSGSIFNIGMTSEDKMNLFKRGYDYADFASFEQILNFPSEQTVSEWEW